MLSRSFGEWDATSSRLVKQSGLPAIRRRFPSSDTRAWNGREWQQVVRVEKHTSTRHLRTLDPSGAPLILALHCTAGLLAAALCSERVHYGEALQGSDGLEAWEGQWPEWKGASMRHVPLSRERRVFTSKLITVGAELAHVLRTLGCSRVYFEWNGCSKTDRGA